MARIKIIPSLHGLFMSPEKWTMNVVRLFEKFDDGKWTVDELMLNPRDAIRFCLAVNEKMAETKKIPESFILRTLMTWRKKSVRKEKKVTSD